MNRSKETEKREEKMERQREREREREKKETKKWPKFPKFHQNSISERKKASGLCEIFLLVMPIFLYFSNNGEISYNFLIDIFEISLEEVKYLLRIFIL